MEDHNSKKESALQIQYNETTTAQKVNFKAQYNPQSAIPSRKPSSISNAAPLSNTVEPRYVYETPYDQGVAERLSEVADYLEKTKVLKCISMFTQALLSKPNLPYNPYPGFVRRLLPLQERFHMFQEDNQIILSRIQNQLQKTTTPLLWGVKGHQKMWGHASVLQYASPIFFDQYSIVLEGVSPETLHTFGHGGYSGQVLKAVIGPSVWNGSLIAGTSTLDVRKEYLIYGPQDRVCLELFIKNIIKDVEDLTENTTHKLLYVICPKTDKHNLKLWNAADITENSEEFQVHMTEAVTEKKIIQAEVHIFSGCTNKQTVTVIKVICDLDPSLQKWVRGRIEFFLHVVVSDQKSRTEDRLLSYSGLPFQTLLEGVFIQKFHAEAYISTFKKTLKKSGITKTQTAKEESTDVLEEIKSDIKKLWESREGTIQDDFFKKVFLKLLKIQLDSVGPSKNTQAVELYRLHHSTAYTFYCAMHVNKLVIEFLQNAESEDLSQTFAFEQFRRFKLSILKALNPKLNERSSNHVIFFESLKDLLEETEGMEEWNTLTKAEAPKIDDHNSVHRVLRQGNQVSQHNFIQILKKLKIIDLYCDSILKCLIEDAVASVKDLNILQQSNTQNTVQEVMRIGAEVLQITTQRSHFLNLEEAVVQSIYPSIIKTEGVFIQYMLDARLDQVWESFLSDLVESKTLPPNPYPRLITSFRKASIKMELFGKTDTNLLELLQNKTLKVVDKQTDLYSLPDSGLYGFRSALLLVDTGFFEVVQEYLQPALKSSPGKERGQFAISSSIALGGFTPLYGRMIPYLYDVRLHHHVYIRGPRNATMEILRLFADFVSEDAKQLRDENEFIVDGVYMDSVLSQLGGNDEEEFSKRVQKATEHKKCIEIKMYRKTDGRYVCLIKEYCLHYLYTELVDEVHEVFFDDSPETIYQYIFFSKEEALEHLQVYSLQDQTVSAKMRDAARDYMKKIIKKEVTSWNMIHGYRIMLVCCLIMQRDDLIPEIWRVMHSTACQLEFVMYLINALKNLVSFCVKNSDKVLHPEQQSAQKNSRRKKKNLAETEAVKTGMIEEDIISKQAQICQVKMIDVLSMPIIYCPKPITGKIKSKLIKTVNFQKKVAQMNIKLSMETVKELEEVNNLIQPLLNVSASEVHSVCNKIHDWIQSIK